MLPLGGEHDAMWGRLEPLVERLGGLDGGLDCAALSAGQKQLFCLARSGFLSRTPVV
jgi:hypothetical protein